jgi:myo-inositol-1(or 4)-monophosphatase
LNPTLLTDAELAIAAAHAAGAGIMRAFGTGLEVTMKSPDQPLTQADLAADRLLKDMLLSARPGYGWLSEETADSSERLLHKTIWVVDPIDGTRSFIANRPEFSVSIAVATRGAPDVGVIHNPATGEMFWGVRGGGAWERTSEGDVRLTVRAASPQPSLLGSRSEIRKGAFDAYQPQFEVSGVGSTAYKMALVAAGKADGFISRGPKAEWDVCAGVLLVEEAGGVATDAYGNPITFNCESTSVRGVLTANRSAHPKLLEIAMKLPGEN